MIIKKNNAFCYDEDKKYIIGACPKKTMLNKINKEPNKKTQLEEIIIREVAKERGLEELNATLHFNENKLKIKFYDKKINGKVESYFLETFDENFWAKKNIIKERQPKKETLIKIAIILFFTEVEKINLIYISKKNKEITNLKITKEDLKKTKIPFLKKQILKSYIMFFDYIENKENSEDIKLRKFQKKDAEYLYERGILFKSQYKKLKKGEEILPYQCKKCKYLELCH